MALGSRRHFFGIHSWTPYSRTDGNFYGIVKCLGGSALSLSGELVKLNGGSSKWPWAVEEGMMAAEMSVKVKEFPDFLVELFLGKAPTLNAAETGGSVTTLTNVKGTSCKSTTTGISAVGIKAGSEVDVKFGKYIVKVASATTVNVYCSSDADFAAGADLSYQDDTLKVTATALTITASAAVDIPSCGLTLTGGSGTIGMTTGDTASFTARPINTKSTDVVIGASLDTFPEFGSIVMGEKRENGELVEIDLYRCKGMGMPLPFEENKWVETEIKAEAFWDPTLNAVFGKRTIARSVNV